MIAGGVQSSHVVDSFDALNKCVNYFTWTSGVGI